MVTGERIDKVEANSMHYQEVNRGLTRMSWR